MGSFGAGELESAGLVSWVRSRGDCLSEQSDHLFGRKTLVEGDG